MAQITESEFARTVEDVAATRSRVESVSVHGFSFKVTFRSSSGKSTWDSHMTFDNDAWTYTYWDNPHYPGAASWAFGDEVQRRLRALPASP